MARLDRLSALLQGLAPQVELVAEPEGFALHLLTQETDQEESIRAEQLKLVICPEGSGWRSLPQFEQGEWRSWMSFEVSLNGPAAGLFLSEFPKPSVIDLSEADSSLTQILGLIANERRETRCGHPLLMDRAGDILLIGVLRHLVANPQRNTGLFFALSNPRIAKSIVAMHTDPSRSWSLEMLADEAGMSRTSFINHFSKIMRISPGKYLENLRLALAKRLTERGITLQQAAVKTGYSSASTLSRALARASKASLGVVATPE